MMVVLRRFRRAAEKDEGFTLTEMLVAMLIFSIVISIVLVTISTFETNLVSQRATAVALDNTEIAAESFTQFLRASQKVLYASPTEIRFVADVGYDAASATVDTATVDAAVVPSRVRGAPANLLRITVGTHQTFLGELLVSSNSLPFEYCTYTQGAVLSASSDPLCPPPAGSQDDPLTVLGPVATGLDAAQLAQVSIVHINFSFAGNLVGASGTPEGLPVTYDTQVSLQNEIPSSAAG